ncbi:type IV secretory system conjugative DNA transfer family protein [Thermomonospora umbrina]|uniref:Type IV secretory system conjugative DNA transfer VirD4/TraG family protein n=1 Tax=Thermomonospora umbrina TaxID=111806 RepID=A0A3D9SFQ4_9ACTN|nr:type IV secretory system conjugative DNA transfer family protein [Thermomonospora umbrina]REE94732.1 type IV secretory system conjugative DNA transfer VirD4/TraG family protein [Thermomonospora umbrina]
MSEAAGLLFGELHLPRPLVVGQVVEWLRHLASLPGPAGIVLEARADADGVRFLLGAPAERIGRLQRQLVAALPGTRLNLAANGRSVRRVPVQTVARLRQHPAGLPLTTDAPEATTRALLSALAGPLGDGEALVVQTVLGVARPPRTVPARVGEPAASLWTLLTKGQPAASGDSRARVARRLGQAGFAATVRVGVAAATPERRRQLITAVLGALATTESPGVRLHLVREPAERLNAAQRPWRWPLQLGVSEVATLLGWPYADNDRNDERDLPGLPPVHPKLLGAAANVHSGRRVFARSAVPGDSRLLGISPQDQTYHGVAYGPSGSGKTTALLHLILADITAGRPVVVLDPKRQLIDDIMARVPAHRIGDVVELNAGNASPVGFNPLDVAGRDPDVVVDGIMAVFQAVFYDGWGPRTADIFSASLRTLARTSTPDRPATLVDLPRLLTDAPFRRPLVGAIQDDVALAGFWSWYEDQNPGAQAAVIAAPLNKLRQFLLRPALVRMLDQRSGRFRLRDVFRDNKVVLVPANEGLVGSGTATLLGNLVVADLWQAIQERAGEADPSGRPGMVFIDEAHRFTGLPVPLADALAQSRSLGVGWFLASQFRSQFPPELRTAIDINGRSKLVFATEHDDARDMARLARGLVAEDFMALGRYQAYANLVADGLPSGWALVKTLPPPPPTTDPARVRAAVAERYGPLPPPPVEPSPSPPGPVGRRQRRRP